LVLPPHSAAHRFSYKIKPRGKAMSDYQFPNNKPSRTGRQKRRDKRLHEEVIECRRRGGGDSNKKCRAKGRVKRLQKEQLSGAPPFRATINERDSWPTSFTDNLEPLVRFLQQNVGRRWDDVYAELSQQLDRSTVTGLHVFQHLEDFVRPQPYQKFDPEDFTSRKTGVNRYFVHPETGILLNGKKENDSNGPFPKKARFIKQKEQRKSKIRLGLPLEKPAQPSLPPPQNLIRHILKHELGSDPKLLAGIC